MKQITSNTRKGVIEVKTVPTPAVGAGEVLVRTRASLISAGTERMVMAFAEKSLVGKAQERPDLVQKVLTKMKRDGVAETLAGVFTKLAEPLPLGYSAAGEVVAVGSKLTSEFKVGDRVAIAGAGLANHAEFCAVPRNLAVPIAQTLSYQHACYATLGAIALHGVRNAQVTLGDRVLIVGLGLVGQLATQLCAAAGAQVAAIDYNPTRCALALSGGAHLAVGGGEEQKLRDFAGSRGFDAILLCAATESDAPLALAAELARDRARVILVGKVGTKFDYATYMKKELTVGVSRSYGPGRYDPAYEQSGMVYPAGFVPHTERDNLAEVCRLMASGQIRVDLLTTHTFSFDDALKAYDLVKGKEAHLGVVLAYGEAAPLQTSITLGGTQQASFSQETLGIGLLGTGAFTRSVMLPALKQVPGARITHLISKGGLSAASAAEGLGYPAHAGTNSADMFADPTTHAIMVMTRHNAHASQVSEALSHGKHVWVEKPLAMSEAELATIAAAHAKATTAHHTEGEGAPILMVGFNRRFSPHFTALRAKLDKLGAPRQILIRVNAGRIEGESWQTSDEGGGRLIGEVCHFTDLALYLAGSPVIRQSRVIAKGQDVYNITLEHENGSVSNLMYTSEGDPATPKERVEVTAGGATGVMDNYRLTTWSIGGKSTVLAKRQFWQRPNKGHAAALTAWVQACKGEKTDLPSLEDLLHSTRVALNLI